MAFDDAKEKLAPRRIKAAPQLCCHGAQLDKAHVSCNHVSIYALGAEVQRWLAIFLLWQRTSTMS